MQESSESSGDLKLQHLAELKELNEVVPLEWFEPFGKKTDNMKKHGGFGVFFLGPGGQWEAGRDRFKALK